MNRRLILLFMIAFSVSFSGFAGLSDRLPIKLVEKIINQNLWEDRYDNSSDSETRNIERFIQKIERQDSAELIVEDLFSGKKGARFSKTYPIKALILRDYIERNYSREVSEASELWIKQYVNFVISFSKSIGTKEVSKIANIFAKKVSSNTILIRDLSEIARNELSLNSNGHSDFLQKDRRGLYTVTGAYSREKNSFYIDLARRSIEQTIVTFVHEMIHAADPELDNAHRDIVKKSESFFNILSKKMDKESLEIFKRQLLTPFLYEKGMQKVHDFLSRKIIKVSRSKSTSFNEDELRIVESWFSAYVRLTVLNEYKAYGESLKFLSKLSHDLDIIHGDVSHYRNLVKEFSKGDEVFIYYQGYIFSPFKEIKSSLFTSKSPKHTLKSTLKTAQDLESIYLKLIKTIGGNNSDYFYDIKKIKFSKSRNANDWTNDLDLPTNPYQVLTSKITTSWALRFKKNIRTINNYMSNHSGSLYALKLGILDLHDVNQGELKLLGIHWKDSKYQTVDSSKSEISEIDLDLISEDIKSQFKLYEWSPDVYEKKSSKTFISSEKVIDNLIRLKLLKINSWVKKNIDGWKLTLLGSRVFVEKLQSGVYVKPSEINYERQRELEEEFLTISKEANISSDTIKEISVLIKQLRMMNSFLKDVEWTELEKESLERIESLESMLNSLGVYGSFDSEEADQVVKQKLEDYWSQLEGHVGKCKKTKKFVNYKASGPLKKELFNMEGSRFKLMLNCYNKEIYAVRQPGDFTRYMTLSYGPNKELAAKIFRGSRKVILSPVKSPIKKKKKAFSFFN